MKQILPFPICSMEGTVARQLASQETCVISEDGVSDLTLGSERAQIKGMLVVQNFLGNFKV